MVQEVKGADKVLNTADRQSFTELIDSLGDTEGARRVLAYITNEHFEDLFRSAFISSVPVIKLIDMPDKNVQYDFELPSGVKQFEFVPETPIRTKYSYVDGEVDADDFIECDRYIPFEESFLNLKTATMIYMKAENNNQKLKLKYWV